MKLNDKDVKHENLFVSDYLPTDLSKYQFVILDSVNNLGLSPQDLQMLKRKNPGKSFIFIFQTTKDGKFKGANSYQHDVDVVIEVPERGKAVQFGRFNQGGEMTIFEDAIPQASEELSGVSNKDDYPKWVTPKILDKVDHDELKHFYRLYKTKKFKAALKYTDDWDTFLRDQIPVEIWKQIGGELTPSGEAKLKRLIQKRSGIKSESKHKKVGFDPSKYSDRDDDQNPDFLFHTTSIVVLVEALRGDFDLKYMIRRELANRGLDQNGKWVGFDKAKELHRI